MHTVKVGRWSELSAAAGSVRRQVFSVKSRHSGRPGVGRCRCRLPAYAVAFNRMGEPLATGRLLEHVPGVAKIGRMAGWCGRLVAPGWPSRAGIALMDAARARGDGEAAACADRRRGFYARAGFQTRRQRVP